MPATFTVSTPTGGSHAYFKAENARNSASEIAKGLDTRGQGGFVVGPGSLTPGGRYDVTLDLAVADAPAWLASRAQRPAGPATPVGEPVGGPVALHHRPLTELDTPDNIARATECAKTAEPAVEGDGGEPHTYQTICRLKDLGVSRRVALELLLEYWSPRCAPSWKPDELEEKVRNAYAYGKLPPGAASPQAEFSPVEITSAPERGLYFELGKDMEPDTELKPLIDGVLDQHAFSVLYGESHTGKTFVALSAAAAIASGSPFANQKSEPGGVVYVAAEGGRGIRKRIAALRQTCDLTHFAVVPCSINLLGANSDVQPLCDLIGRAGLALKTPVVLVVIDTLSRSIAGANENSSEDMTAFVRACDKIRSASGAHLMVVHHAGKDTSKGARGHSSLRAATDTELEVEDEVLRVRKQRDGEHIADMPFRLREVQVGERADGRAITSCVVEWAGPGEDFKVQELTDEETETLDMLRAAYAREGSQPVTTGDVAAEYRQAGAAVSEATVLRRVRTLREKGQAKQAGRKWVPMNPEKKK